MLYVAPPLDGPVLSSSLRRSPDKADDFHRWRSMAMVQIGGWSKREILLSTVYPLAPIILFEVRICRLMRLDKRDTFPSGVTSGWLR